ncbi:MAG: hypothetical protein ACD_20C00350G0006 [uncultured bacterium]|nr:MAG: hypothetical protein ACD_20C00350G0006 [uncultured bacterium]
MFKRDFLITLVILNLFLTLSALSQEISGNKGHNFAPIEMESEKKEIPIEAPSTTENSSTARLKASTSRFEIKHLEEVHLGIIKSQEDSKLGYYLNNRPTSQNEILNNRKSLISSSNNDPENIVYIAQPEVPIGTKSIKSKLFLDAIRKSETQNSSSDDLNLKIGWDWNFLDYSLNATNEEDRFTGIGKLTTGGQVAIKPLYKNPELGNLEFGGGYYTDPNSVIKQDTYSLFSGYKADKYAIKGGFSRQDYGPSKVFSDSWFVSNTLSLTDRISIIAVHKEFDLKQRIENDLGLEYAIKSVPFLQISNLSIQINTSYIQYAVLDDTQRAGLCIKYSF